MRHLTYFWRMGPDTAMFQLPFFYDGIFLRGPEAYSAENDSPASPLARPGPADYNLRQRSGVLTGWDSNAWPEAGIPFSLFTSQYGSAGKRPRGLFSYLPDGLGNESIDSFDPAKLPSAGPGTGKQYGALYEQGSNIPFDNWDKKQISQPPMVKADQFLVFNNFGSTPGILPDPKITPTFAFYTMVFDMRIAGALPNLARIVSIDFCETEVNALGPTGDLQGPANIPEEQWIPIEVAFGYPLVTIAGGNTNPQTKEEILALTQRGCFFSESDPRLATNPGNDLRGILVNSLIYPANSIANLKEFAQTIPGTGDPRLDAHGWLGTLNYEGGVVGLFPWSPAQIKPPPQPNIGWDYVIPGDPRTGEVGSVETQGYIGPDSGYLKIQQILTMVRYSPEQAPPQLRIRYYAEFGKAGGGAITTTYATTYSGTGPHGPITPPNRYDNNLNPLFSEGPIYQIEYPNNNEINFVSDYKPNGFVNLVVNDSRYYQNPDMTPSLGISGDAAPFPKQPGIKVPQYDLRPNVYVLPGQTYDVEYTVNTDMPALANYLTRVGNVNFGGSPFNVTTRPAYGWDFAQVFFDYWLFEGAEALICHKLLKLGIDIHPDSVDWYKQMILNMEGLQPDTYEKYLILMKEWKKRQEILDKAYHRKRGMKARNR